MNRGQRERVEDLGRAFQDALTDIINMGEEVSDRTEAVGREYESEPGPISMPAYPSLAPHEINIRQVHNGFIVSAGCQTFVFEKFETASKYIKMYFDSPSEVEDKHREGTLFK
jgi:hypothetical protein